MTKQSSSNHKVHAKLSEDVGGGEIRYTVVCIHQGDGQYWLSSLTASKQEYRVNKETWDALNIGDTLTLTLEKTGG